MPVAVLSFDAFLEKVRALSWIDQTAYDAAIEEIAPGKGGWMTDEQSAQLRDRFDNPSVATAQERLVFSTDTRQDSLSGNAFGFSLSSASFAAAATGRSAASTPKIIAISKFVAGPASATFTAPVRGFFKLFGLYGTGFMPAKKNPVVKNNTTGMMNDRNRSRCFS